MSILDLLPAAEAAKLHRTLTQTREQRDRRNYVRLSRRLKKLYVRAIITPSEWTEQRLDLLLSSSRALKLFRQLGKPSRIGRLALWVTRKLRVATMATMLRNDG